MLKFLIATLHEGWFEATADCLYILYQNKIIDMLLKKRTYDVLEKFVDKLDEHWEDFEGADACVIE